MYESRGKNRRARWWAPGLMLAACGLCLSLPSASLAHKVTVFAWVDGDVVRTESRFSRGRMVRNGRIAVYDPDGVKLLAGETDDEGRFSFPLPALLSRLRVELDAGPGHRAEWALEIAREGDREPVARARPDPEALDPPAGAGPSAGEIRQAVEEALEAKLDPVIRMLLEARDPGPSVTEILGGIGYILGLAGVAAYALSRRGRGGPPPNPRA